MKNKVKSTESESPKVLILSALGVGSVVGYEVIRLVTEEILSKGGLPLMVALKSQKLPLFDGETDFSVFPLEAKNLAQSIGLHDALMIVAPEYHQGIAPLVKNSLDWVGRAHALAQTAPPLLGKSVAVVTLSSAHHLGVQALTQMSALCHALGGLVLPSSMGVLDQATSLGEDHRLKDQGLVKRLSALALDLVQRRRRL